MASKTTTKKKTYTVSVVAVDSYSPARKLVVKENGSTISYKAIYYTDGEILINSSSATVAQSALSGETELSNGTKVKAKIS